MQEADPRVRRGSPGAALVPGPARLVRSFLAVRLCEDGGLRFLEVRNRLEPAQSFLLPLGHRPELSGLSIGTRLGRIHSVCWGLAYGFGDLADQTVACFETDTLRYRRSVDAFPRRLADDVWLAVVEGVFDSVSLLLGDRTVRRVRLAGSW